MSKKIIRGLVVAVGLAAPLAVGSPAMANPNFQTTPAANPAGGLGPNEVGYVCTYKAPPAYGDAAPGSSAAGGEPGSGFNMCPSAGKRN